MSLTDTERAFLDLCCAPAVPTSPMPSGVLDAEHGKIWGVYRQMVRGRFLEEIKLGLRRTLKAAGEPALSEMFTRFMAEAPPRSRAFYGVVPEFAAFAAACWSENTASPTLAAVPAWVADLARYEAARYQVADLPAQRSRPVVEFDFDRVPVVHSAVVLLSLAYRVHRDPAADGSYEKAPTELCVYRAADERTVGAYVLNRFNAACLRAWQAGATVSQSVRNVSEAQGTPADAKIIDALCTALSDLMERGVVLGSQP